MNMLSRVFVVCGVASIAALGCTSTPDPPPAPIVPEDTGVCAPFDAGPAAPDVIPVFDTGIDPDDTGPRPDTGPAFDAGAPVARTQIDDILKTSCSFSSCHGGAPNGIGTLYMPVRTVSDWYPNLVGHLSTENPTLMRVKPGDPSHSWIVQKLSGGNCGFASVCKDHDCGARMPKDNPPIDARDLQAIVRWILQGAPQE